MLSQWAARTDTLKAPLSAIECRYPVSFVGSAYGNRPRWISELSTRGIDVSCFGHGWPGGSVAADDIPRIVRESVVSLNFGDSGWHFRGLLPFRSRQIKARVFEVPGAGGCLLTEQAEHLDDFYHLGVEIEVFQDIDDLAEKIRYLIAHAKYRDAVAQAGYSRTMSEHTYETRFREMLEWLPKREKEAGIDFGGFERIAARYRVGLGLRLLRAFLVMPFQLVWGPRRGPRAARRIFAELSCRLNGRGTYSAAGLPGRLFYRES
jgi:spore maturation protein CgeB